DPRPAMRRLIHVGTKGFNYENNLAYMAFLASLKIPFDRLIVEDAPHSATRIYAEQGRAIMQFHVDSFRESGALK
ncbi:MAG: 1,4-beta-xylanase, partial [Verrucomicrobiota bacterium]